MAEGPAILTRASPFDPLLRGRSQAPRSPYTGGSSSNGPGHTWAGSQARAVLTLPSHCPSPPPRGLVPLGHSARIPFVLRDPTEKAQPFPMGVAKRQVSRGPHDSSTNGEAPPTLGPRLGQRLASSAVSRSPPCSLEHGRKCHCPHACRWAGAQPGQRPLVESGSEHVFMGQ